MPSDHRAGLLVIGLLLGLPAFLVLAFACTVVLTISSLRGG